MRQRESDSGLNTGLLQKASASVMLRVHPVFRQIIPHHSQPQSPPEAMGSRWLDLGIIFQRPLKRVAYDKLLRGVDNSYYSIREIRKTYLTGWE